MSLRRFVSIVIPFYNTESRTAFVLAGTIQKRSLTVMQSTLKLEKEGAILSVLGKSDLEKLNAFDGAAQLNSCDRREKEIELARELTGAKRVFALDQVHGIASIKISPESKDGITGTADALLAGTAEKSFCIIIRTADCLPLFFLIKSRGQLQSVGIIHAGWRGLAAGIVPIVLGSALEGMVEPEMILVAGPCISGENYEVSKDVADQFELSKNKSGRWFVDLLDNAKHQVEHQFKEIPITWIDNFLACTQKSNDRFYSHRAGDTGRNLNLLTIL